MRVILTQDLKAGTELNLPEDIVKQNKELFEEVKKGRWEPKELEYYWVIESWWSVTERRYNSLNKFCSWHFKSWNCYKIKNQAKAMNDRDIFANELIDKFWYVEENEEYYYFNTRYVRIDSSYPAAPYTYIHQRSWLNLHWNTTEEERQRMLELIKKSEWI